MDKTVLALIYGGQSSEHEVSCMSAATVIGAVNTEKYELIKIGITKDGRWILNEGESVSPGSWENGSTRAVLSPDAGIHGLILLREGKAETKRVDVVCPVLHGLFGEDGTIQGVCELAGIPYIGCGVLSSAVSMDKVFTKAVVERYPVSQAAYAVVLKKELSDMEAVIRRIEEKLPYPVFVKPANAGSSRGVSKAADREELAAALAFAAAEDSKILVEETIVGRELECAVLQDGGDILVSGVGEILAAAEFYDYDAKYNNSDSRTGTDPVLPEGKTEEIRRAARTVFGAVDGRGLSRVDFFLEEGTDRVIFNEINTLPGFTSISMYPMLFEKCGIGLEELVERLIRSAFERAL